MEWNYIPIFLETWMDFEKNLQRKVQSSSLRISTIWVLRKIDMTEKNVFCTKYLTEPNKI